MTVAKEMNNGVALLIERMKTHPEEFVPEYDGGVTKWGNAIGQYRTYLTAEDSKALDDAWKETVVTAMRQKFTERVLEELVDPKSQINPYLASPTAMPLGGATQGHSTALNQATNALNAIGSPYTLTANNNGNISWTSTAPSLTIGDTTLNEATIKQMLATHRAMREQTKPKRWWNKTIPELLGDKK